MAAFSERFEYDGESMNWLSLCDIFDEALNHIDTDYIYWSRLITNYKGKNIEIKITDIEKDKKYKERIKK